MQTIESPVQPASDRAHSEGMSTRPFFIVGCGRSGTTLLREMLNAHPHLSIPPECPFLLGYLYRPEMSAGLATKLLLKEPWLNEWKLPLRREQFADCTNALDVVTRLHVIYQLEHGGRRWGQKTPKFVRHLGHLRRLYPDAQFIHIIRDGRAVAASYLRAPWGPTNIVAAAQYWRWNVLQGLKFARRYPDRCVSVRYEDLVADPHSEITRLLEFLQEPFDQRVLNYEQHTQGFVNRAIRSQFNLLGKPVSTDRTEQWRRELTPQQVALFEGTAGRLLTRMGYALDNPQVGKVSLATKRRSKVRDALGRATNHTRMSLKHPWTYTYEVLRRSILMVRPTTPLQ
jgi:hypothetical protein